MLIDRGRHLHRCVAATAPALRALVVLALAQLAALGQAALGGVTVLTGLNPWTVSFHLLCSLAIIGLAVLFLHRLSTTRRRRPWSAARPLVLAWLTFGSAWVVLYLGTVVTGSGPHAGDEDAARNGLDPLQVSQLHADSVFLFLGLCVGLFFTVRYPRPALAAAQRCCWE